MKDDAFTEDQLNELVRRVNVATAEALPKAVGGLDPGTILHALEGEESVEELVGDLKSALRRLLKRRLTLVPEGTRAVMITKRRAPSAYFRDCPDLSDGDRNILEKAVPMPVGTILRVNLSRLGRNVDDRKIEKRFPSKTHLFGESEAAALVMEIRSRRKSSWQQDGRMFILYTNSCVLGLEWDEDDGEFVKYVFQRSNTPWCAGDCVLTPA